MNQGVYVACLDILCNSAAFASELFMLLFWFYITPCLNHTITLTFCFRPHLQSTCFFIIITCCFSSLSWVYSANVYHLFQATPTLWRIILLTTTNCAIDQSYQGSIPLWHPSVTYVSTKNPTEHIRVDNNRILLMYQNSRRYRLFNLYQ